MSEAKRKEKQKKSRKNRKSGLTVFVIILIILALLAALAVWQRENINAFLDAFRYSEDELAAQYENNRDAIDTIIEMNPEITVRDVTEEESKALESGEISEEELIEELTELPGGAEETDPNVSRVNELLAKVYILRTKFTGTLDAMVEEAKQEYWAMSPEQKTKANLASWASGYVSRANALEKECDKEMDAIVAELKSIAEATDGDKAIVNEVIITYSREKSIKKSMYLAKAREKGLM